jgi:hypothetical protein
VPVFPLTVKIVTGPLISGPVRLSTHGNLSPGRRVLQHLSEYGEDGPANIAMQLLLPAGTDIRGPASSTGADSVEVPSGSGRWYGVFFVDDIAKGFSNEHRLALLAQYVPQPTPLP